MIVVDASVAVKWFLPEADSEQAAALLQSEGKLFAPELIRVEVASAITRRVRVGELAVPYALAACTAWDQALAAGVVTLSGNEIDLPRAIDIATDLKHPLQDCLYLACAERLDVPLVTGDVKFREKAVPIYPNVRVISIAGMSE